MSSENAPKSGGKMKNLAKNMTSTPNKKRKILDTSSDVFQCLLDYSDILVDYSGDEPSDSDENFVQSDESDMLK